MPEVRLRPMTAAEYRAYRERAVPDYADEVQRNTGIDRAAALRHAERVFTDLLPDGLATRGHRLLIAEHDDGRAIGRLWLADQQREGLRAAWIYDVEVDPELRGHGYGRRLMELAEGEARELGVQRMELNVFGDNPVARGLYESMGYVEMSRQLFKDLA